MYTKREFKIISGAFIFASLFIFPSMAGWIGKWGAIIGTIGLFMGGLFVLMAEVEQEQEPKREAKQGIDKNIFAVGATITTSGASIALILTGALPVFLGVTFLALSATIGFFVISGLGNM